MRSIQIGLGSALLSSLMGCGTPSASSEEENTASATFELGSEQTGVVEYIYRQYRKFPGVTLASYATPDMGGCGAAMIGPNIMITAAHCGLASGVTFRTYPNGGSGGPTVATTTSYNCRYLVHSYWDSDINIHFCDPGPDGINPGDRHGYLDLDPTPPHVGQQVYSPWTNQQPTTQVPVALMYSPGKITRNDLSEAELWARPGGGKPIGIESNVYAEPGASGSPQLDAISNKIVVGPNSIGPGGGGQWRGAVSIFDYLYWGRADPGNATPPVNDSAISALGLDPQNYWGWLDKELDWLFDIQSDLERLRGESQRNWYELGFRSARKNKLWDPVFPLASFNGSSATVTRSDSAAGIVLRHSRLNLVDGGRYVLSGLLRRTTGTAEIWLGLRSDAGGYFGTWLTNKSAIPFAIPVTATGPNSELVVWLSGNGTYDISELTLARSEGSITMDFDDGEQRKLWNDGAEFPGPAFIVPDGKSTTPNTQNWAAYVPQSASVSYTARFDRVPVATGKSYQVCFDVRRDFNLPFFSLGRVNVRGGQSDVNLSFIADGEWRNSCLPSPLAVVGSVTIQFGRESGPAYRVDNVKFTEAP